MQKLFEFVEHIGKWRVLVQTRDIQNGAVTTAKIADDAVTTEKIGDGEVKSGNINDNAVITDKIGDGEVKTRNIDTGAVTTAKIEDWDENADYPTGVTTDKIADGAVATSKIPDGAIVTDKIGKGEIKSANIGKGAVTTDKIEDYNENKTPSGVTTDKIADGAVTTDKIGAGEVKSGNIGAGQVKTGNIGAGEVMSVNIGAGEVKSGNIGAGQVKTGNIGDGEVKTRNIDTGAVTTAKIEDYDPDYDPEVRPEGTGVTTPKIADSAVTTQKIEDGAVTTDKIEDYDPNAARPTGVTTAKIGPHAVTREKIADGAISQLLGLMDEFVDAVRAETSQQQPITIRGNVNNAADEEDLTADVSTRLLKLKDRSGEFGYAMKILRRNKTFTEQVNQMRCIYVVQYDFDLGGGTVEMPAESLVLFTGGRLLHGTLEGTKNTGGDAPGEAAFGLILCSALYYDYLEDVTLEGVYQDETAKSLQEQINAIVSDKATVALTPNPSVHFVGDNRVFVFSATSTPTVAQVRFDGGAETNTPATFNVTVSSDEPKHEDHSASFKISGVNKGTKSARIKLVYPIYYGLQASYNASTLAQYPTAKDKAAGDYTVNVNTNSRKLYFRIPQEEVTQITSVSLVSGAFVNEIQGGINASLSGNGYNVWESTDPINVQSDADAGDRIIRVA